MSTHFSESANSNNTVAKVINFNAAQVFGRVIKEYKQSVIARLCKRYPNLPYDDAADIVQESCIDLWVWSNKKGRTDMTENDILCLWKRFSRFRFTHWIAKESKTTSLDDAKLNITISNVANDTDSDEQMEKREMVYDCLGSLNDKERTLVTMTMDGKKTDEICLALGFKNKAVLKNFKCRTLKKVKSELSHRMAA